MKRIIKVYTDGGCNPNPGPGKWAWAINKKENSVGYEEHTTNNRMELTAIFQAIKHIKKHYPDHEIEIYSDSQYCVKGFNEWMIGWQKKDWYKSKGNPVKNHDLWKKLFSSKNFVTLKWVKGHSGDKMNDFVDSLCTMSGDSKGVVKYPEYKGTFKPTKDERALFDIIEKHYPFFPYDITRKGFYQKIRDNFKVIKK